jgi:altered-inheritance-of-mitochondria protein 13
MRPHALSPSPRPQVSSELATQLSDTSLSPEVTPTRRTLLDNDVRAKIGAEAARLRGHGSADDHHEAGVDIVQREIEAALERENLDRERGMTGDAGDAGEHGDVKNSTVLLGDLEEVRQKVDRYRTRASLTEHPEVKEAREAIAPCYRYVLLPSRCRGLNLFRF